MRIVCSMCKGKMLNVQNRYRYSIWMVFTKVRVRSVTTKELMCAHVCVRTLIWMCEVRACDAKNGRNSHLAVYQFVELTYLRVQKLCSNCN